MEELKGTTKKAPVLKVDTKISKGYLEKIDHLCADIEIAWSDLETAVIEFNEETKQRWENKVVSALDTYNGFLSEANELRGEIADAMQAYFDDKSEGWQDGDKGQAYQEWMDEWMPEIDQVELEAPEEVEFNIENDAYSRLAEEMSTSVPS